MISAKLQTFLLFALIKTVYSDPLRLNTGGTSLSNIGFIDDVNLASVKSNGFTTKAAMGISGTWAPVYKSHRYTAASHLQYKIPVPAGSYPISMLWSETWAGSGPGKRVFTVKVNGQFVNKGAIKNGQVDVFKSSGGRYKPLFVNVGTFKPQDGFITIEFGKIPGKNNPFISGIVLNNAKADFLIPGSRSSTGGSIPLGKRNNAKVCAEATKITGRISKNSFGMNVGGPAIAGINFGADNENYIVESKKGWRVNGPSVKVPPGSTWQKVYKQFRASVQPTLTYKIPVPAGKYLVALLFAENIFTQANVRVFDIFINDKFKLTLDVFKKVGLKKSYYIPFGNTPSVNGFIKIQIKRKIGNQFLSGIQISGPGAATIAIGGKEDGKCAPASKMAPAPPSVPTSAPPPPPTSGPVTKPIEGIKPPETNFKGEHFAHAVAGGPYVVTDFDGDGRALVNLDGTNSHSHFQKGTETGKIIIYKWIWKDSKNPSASSDGTVSFDTKTANPFFPLGVTHLSLLVVDQFGNSAIEKTTVTVNSATVPGAYCYYYNLESKNPKSVELPLDVKKQPKPLKGGTNGDINFHSTASFKVPFAANAFNVRCVFSINIVDPAVFQYKVVHTGPIKLFHMGSLVASTNSRNANQQTFTAPKKYATGLQQWQLHYLRPKGLNGKLVFQFGSGSIVPASIIRHDAGTVLPVITGLSKKSTSPLGGELISVFGSAFVNGVKVMFGNKVAETVESTSETITARAPPHSGGMVKITVTTKAGDSNGVDFFYTSSDIPVKFTTGFLKETNGKKYYIPQIAAITFGPDQRLYLGAVNSQIYALTVSKSLAVTKKCQTSVFQKYPRTVLGLAFNPKSNDLKLYMSTSTIFWKDRKQFTNFGAGWTNGKIQTITMAGPNGCFNDDLKDFVTGLPVSNHDHAINQITFLPNGNILIAVGGFTNGGISVPFDNLGGIPSNPLAGALVVCQPGGGNIKYSNINNPLLSKIIGGGCSTYATGLRNTFSLTLHSNGHVYATDNGPNKNFGEFSTNCNGGQKPSQNIPDKLFKIQPGKWHGHPSINRKECVFYGPGAVKPLLNNLQSSTNGVIEYRSNAFDGKIKGDLFISKFAVNGAGKLSRAQLDGSGNIKPNGFTNLFLGESGLSIAEGPRGVLFMPRVYQSSILVAIPVYPAPSTTTVISVLPNRGSAGGGTTIEIAGHLLGNKAIVKIGGKTCTNVVSIDWDTLTCKTPPGSGKQKISVTGVKGTWTSETFDYWYF